MSMHTTFSLTEVHISICNPYNQLQLLENNFSDFPLSPVDRDNDILQKIKNVMVEKLSSSGVKLSFSKNVCMCVCVCVCVCVLVSHVQLFVTSWTVACQALLSQNSPGKNTGVGCHSLLQGIFPIRGWSPDLLHCRQILYCLSHQGSSTRRIWYDIWKFYLTQTSL